MDTIVQHQLLIPESHISPLKYPKQISRIKLDRPGYIHGFVFHMEGNGFGEFDVDVYGSEGGAYAPYFKQKLCRSHSGIKTEPGRQSIEVIFSDPLYVEGSQFFVSVAGFSSNFGIMQDSSLIDDICYSELGGDFYPTILMNKKGKHRRLKSTGALEVYFEFIPKEPNLFKEVTKEIRLPENLPDHSIAVADVDNNGWQDLLIGSQLFFNSNGVFEKQEVFPMSNQVVRKSCFIDMDLDGDEDILFFGAKYTKLWVNEGGGFFSEKILDLPNLKYLRAYSIADINGDGYLDLFCAQLWDEYPCPQANYLFVNDGNLGFLDETQRIYPKHKGNSNFPQLRKCNPGSSNTHLPNRNQNRRSRATSFADYDQDGDQDLYVANYYLEKDELYINDGAGNFKLIKAPRPEGQSSKTHNHSTGVNWVDYDNDLDFDLYVSALAHPPNMVENDHRGGVLYERLGNKFVDQSFFDGIQYEETQAGSKFGDVNNDGYIDLISTAYYECRYPSLYLSDSTHTFNLATHFSGFQNLEAAPDLCFFDYNNDGKLDVAMIVNQQVRIFKNVSANDNHWIGLNIIDEEDGVIPVGSIVKVYSGTAKWMQQIGSGTGQAMQEPKRLHFGLGKETVVDSIKISTGIKKVQTFFNLSSNTIHDLTLKN